MTQPLADPISRLVRWQNDSTNGRGPGPSSIILFPTNICNIECKHCWQRWATYDKTYKSEMSDERLMRLVDEAAALDVRSWYFVGGGDPLGRAKIVMQMMAKIREYGMNGALHCNGTLLKPWMMEQLVDTQWEHVRVSLDGPTAEINDFIRSRGFDKATGNLKQLVKLKEERGATSPALGIHVTVTNLNYDKMDQFVELAHSLGPQIGVQLSGLVVEDAAADQFSLTPEQKHAFPEFVHKGIERAKELGVGTNFEFYLNEELVHDATNMHRNYVPKVGHGLSTAMCYEPWTSLSVLPDGRVGPCCMSYSETAHSLKNQPLEEVWNGPYLTHIRASMLNGNPPEFCSRCPSILYIKKENERVVYSKVLEREYSWRELSTAGRLRYVVSRGTHSLREVGVAGTFRRSVNWAQIRMAASAEKGQTSKTS